jgi:glycosyltransferase involved in cell wall biosynthesis
MRPSAPAVGYLLRSYPRLSQTFVLNEILSLERRGVRLQLFALSNPHETEVQAEVAEVRAPIHYLERSAGSVAASVRRVIEHGRAIIAGPRRYLSTLLFVLRHGELDSAYRTATRLQCFQYAVRLRNVARTMERDSRIRIDHLHAHFAHDPALVALLTQRMAGIPFSFTAHARDLYQVPPASLARRVEEATAVVACCATNADYLSRTLSPHQHRKIRLIHHGVDTNRFRPAATPSLNTAPPLILSVGRLVEKKGFDDLIMACRELERKHIAFRCEVYGDGPERERLQELIDSWALADRVVLFGARPVRKIIPAYQDADVFALTPFVTEDGDRDGIPNVLLEAMASGLPVVTTGAGGISELVQDGVNGLLSEPRDVKGIAANLRRLLSDPSLRSRLGVLARRTVTHDFDSRASTRQLMSVFGSATSESS